ncbi:MAG: WbuC family cupin fold metalloprotein [Gammaproteobacteria bacterium]|nr:WbuC family cupin fold metalloprotein [Gammaproteobacteria bacterium]MBU1416425.1 WbuC family cupin fold metalloprotein [Gammaproteobacteria bacterium]
MIRLIDNALLDEVSAEARASARGRKNRNFHTDDAQPGHRLLNAIEPGSYVAPHRHLDPSKSETMVVLRGSMGLVTFDDAGEVVEATKVCGFAPSLASLGTATSWRPAPSGLVSHGGTPMGVDIPAGTWHTVFALEPGTVFFEAKAGPYLPLTVDEKASWAPAEGDPGAPAYLARLAQLLN